MKHKLINVVICIGVGHDTYTPGHAWSNFFFCFICYLQRSKGDLLSSFSLRGVGTMKHYEAQHRHICLHWIMSFLKLLSLRTCPCPYRFPVSVFHRWNTSYLSNNKEHVQVNITYIMFFSSLLEYQGNQ